MNYEAIAITAGAFVLGYVTSWFLHRPKRGPDGKFTK